MHQKCTTSHFHTLLRVFFSLINYYLSILYIYNKVWLFSKSHIFHTLYLIFSLCLTAQNAQCIFSAIFCKKMHEKGNHLCSSLLKIVFHHHLPFLITNRKIWSHCLEVLVSSVCSNQFFIPTFFRTMHDKSSSGCMC